MKRVANQDSIQDPNPGTIFRCDIATNCTNVVQVHWTSLITPPLSIYSFQPFEVGRYWVGGRNDQLGGLPREIRAKIASYFTPSDWHILFTYRVENLFSLSYDPPRSYYRNSREIQLILHCLGFQRRRWWWDERILCYSYSLYAQ